IVETHEAAADCGTGKIAILRLTHHGNIQLDAIVQNSCALTAAIAAGKNGAPDTLTLHGPYYAKDAALCCPTISNATATLAYRNGEWSLSPTYYQLQTTGLHTEDQGKAWRKWLPSLDLEDVRQHLPQSSTSRLDYFICPNQPTANLSYYGFEYAVSGCPNLAGGSAYEHGPAGPERGQALYDYGHQILLFSRGCCSVESFVVAAGIGSPPMPVARADLAGISTHRGLRLGMTQKQVVQIYGPARAEPVPAHPGLVAIAYGAKAPGHTVKCGGQLGDQYFLFAFRDDALTYMEIDTGC
ncbi:MAG TPA: hypothetical protein VME66_05910, partial [Candidatus Acidoferrales bacterium]|nr:hypothetical protein [Candidatus Acidoferrales bacterium]